MLSHAPQSCNIIYCKNYNAKFTSIAWVVKDSPNFLENKKRKTTTTQIVTTPLYYEIPSG